MQNYRVGSGLSNLGNTCFFNAVIQVILHTQSLAYLFSVNQHSTSCQSSKWCILCSLESLFHQSKKNRVSSPMAIVHNLKSIFKKFKLGRQEDSHEFLRYLVEGMQEVETGKLGKDRQKNEQRIVQTPTFKIFGGRMRNCVLCHNCGYKSLTSERYYDLNIECQRSNSLVQGIASFFRPDELKGINKYYCQKCQQQSNALKTSQLITVPEVMTFQLKRFTNSLRKIGKMVQYPKYINVGKYFQQPCENYRLELYAVTVHSGYSSGSGHYYSYVKWNGEWFEMNDSHVSQCSQQKAMNQQAYMLFYKRLSPKTSTRKDSMMHEAQEQKMEIDENEKEKEEKCEQRITNDKQMAESEEKIEQNVEQKKEDKQDQEVKCLNKQIGEQQNTDNQTPKKRRTKEEVMSELTLQQLLFRYAEHISQLTERMISLGKRRRSCRRYSLCKYEIIMKRKKLY